MKVYVVLVDGAPHSVFASKDVAEKFVKEWNADAAARHSAVVGSPLVQWKSAEFDLQGYDDPVEEVEAPVQAKVSAPLSKK